MVDDIDLKSLEDKILNMLKVLHRKIFQRDSSILKNTNFNYWWHTGIFETQGIFQRVLYN